MYNTCIVQYVHIHAFVRAHKCAGVYIQVDAHMCAQAQSSVVCT